MIAQRKVISIQGKPARDPAIIDSSVKIVECIRTAMVGRNGGVALNDNLVAVANTRDREAFAELFGHFAPRIKAFMLKRGCDSAAAEEIAQMTLVTVWRKATLFKPQKASAATWVFTIARNLHIDTIRKSKRPAPDPTDPFFVPMPEKPADMSIAEQQDANKVQAAISTLPSEQQDVLRLSFYEEKSHGEIAKQLGVPLGTVKSRMRLAFGKIRNVIGDIE
ncbi:MAG: sigma-70 family RNA polymerase sigma factor [Alphaproteobacteria bacterium]|nr:sigma-70 family RNA polymerase sigma factor [Alphaproteobacteria bacterium]